MIIAPSSTMAGVIWTYDEDYTGQEEWGWLSKDFAVCAQGTQQSPIQISYTKQEDIPPLEIHYQQSTGYIRHTGHAIEITVDGSNTLIADGKTYHLETIQLHTPGEHTVQDDFFLVEIEMLHKSSDGKMLMLSILGNTGNASSAFESIIASAPKRPGAKKKTIVDLRGLLPSQKGYYAYTGSLTSPPCTEGVEWRIFKQPIDISQAQLEKLGKLLGRNARLIQPVYMRTVKETMN